MKKFLSLITSLCVITSAISITASAQEYEKFDGSVPMNEEHIKELSDGIKEGRYFADFDGNGMFDPIDAMVVLQYYASLSTLPDGATPDDVDWDGSTRTLTFDEEFWGGFLHNYNTFDRRGETAVTIELNNEMLENVKKYGDINNDGVIIASDASHLLAAYYYSFEIGDVNADGKVSASDASYVLQYYSKNSTGQDVDTYTEQAMDILGDVNGDGDINASDATAILSIYSKLATSE